MTQYLEDVLPPIQSAGLNTQKNISTTGTLSSGAQTVTGAMASTGAVSAKTGTAVPATAGAVAAGAPITMFSSGISIWVTSDAPTHTATKGDLCLNTGGSSTSTRLYINNGTTNWVAITTAS
jgi:hypothetical protein